MTNDDAERKRRNADEDIDVLLLFFCCFLPSFERIEDVRRDVGALPQDTDLIRYIYGLPKTQT